MTCPRRSPTDIGHLFVVGKRLCLCGQEVNPDYGTLAANPCTHEDAERLSVCCGAAEFGDESDICRACRDHTGFELVCGCGEILPDPRNAPRRRVEPVDCPVNDPSCEGADGESHDACEAPETYRADN